MVGDRDGYRAAPRGNCQELQGEIKAAPVFRQSIVGTRDTVPGTVLFIRPPNGGGFRADRLRVTVSSESGSLLFLRLPFSRRAENRGLPSTSTRISSSCPPRPSLPPPPPPSRATRFAAIHCEMRGQTRGKSIITISFFFFFFFLLSLAESGISHR